MSATSASGQQHGDLPARWAPASPAVALVPGVVLVVLGAWAVSDGELPAPFSWVLVAVGVAFLITGAVAKGVAWGLALRDEGVH
ncbi:hypothetical protein GCM10011584_07380 [Nocardioides phosphati]|uniref:DUF4175 domain-containing protein n=1 Tax=Nocardioides phosphati TaxID=1867775 RepID=A0ABQ2N673_9ACTN|nr:hypothetical protein GCM10011584_07380 [Nocardioides phosphati]